jgi:hypothetical protein
MEYRDIKVDDIINWCVKHNETEWLKRTADKVIPNKDGEGEHRITFIELKLEFVKKFMPEIAPESKPKRPSMYDRIKAL